MSSALDRIRQVARLRKKERFTTLFHHINLSLLRLAFFALKRDAAPGVDGLMAGSARLRLPPSRTRSFRERRSQC